MRSTTLSPSRVAANEAATCAAADVSGSYSQEYAGDYFNGTPWEEVVRNSLATLAAGGIPGCSRRQLLWKVQLPLALPEIMLGVNQTIMLALSMLVITALVGTRDLGQEVYIALTKADIGRGLVAGICVAFIAMTADRLISPWSARRKRRLGLD